MKDQIETTDMIDLRDITDRIEMIEDSEEIEDIQELAELKELLQDCEGCDGPLIRGSYFSDYAQELAEDCGLIPSTYTWPISCIDWDQASEELLQAYTFVEFRGVDYWVR